MESGAEREPSNTIWNVPTTPTGSSRLAPDQPSDLSGGVETFPAPPLDLLAADLVRLGFPQNGQELTVDEQGLRIGAPGGSDRAVWPQVLMGDGKHQPFFVTVLYDLASGADGLPRGSWTWVAIAADTNDQLSGRSATKIASFFKEAAQLCGGNPAHGRTVYVGHCLPGQN